MDVLLKHVTIVLLTYIGSLGFLELMKLTDPTRFLFGMRLKKRLAQER